MQHTPEPGTTEYRTYVLRLSREPQAAQWHITVRPTDPASPTLVFADFDALAAWLARTVARPPGA